MTRLSRRPPPFPVVGRPGPLRAPEANAQLSSRRKRAACGSSLKFCESAYFSRFLAGVKDAPGIDRFPDPARCAPLGLRCSPGPHEGPLRSFTRIRPSCGRPARLDVVTPQQHGFASSSVRRRLVVSRDSFPDPSVFSASVQFPVPVPFLWPVEPLSLFPFRLLRWPAVNTHENRPAGHGKNQRVADRARPK